MAASAAGAAMASPASDGGAPANSYINLNSLNASTVRADGRRGILTVDVGVDVPDAALRAEAARSGPRLRAAMSEAAQRIAGALRPGEPPDVDRLSRDLQAAADRTLGRRGARVLLGTVMVV